MGATTTIKIGYETKSSLDHFRQYKNESYDEILRKMVYIVKNLKTQPKLSQKTVEEIEAARERIKQGRFYTEDEMAKVLGIE
ncbi:MAG: hypothetical protein MSIBF_06705 [Candidatus Altiarchaeales archaeon IMC4]|nr:MAG: hypothetical protein MSIBF_06705 [Candidatus Altiarchaeales archaeon IMC4]